MNTVPKQVMRSIASNYSHRDVKSGLHYLTLTNQIIHDMKNRSTRTKHVCSILKILLTDKFLLKNIGEGS